MNTSTLRTARRFGQSAKEYDDCHRPFLGDLTAEQIKAARAQVRCEHDQTAVAVVVAGVLLTRFGRWARSVQDESVLAPCPNCDLWTRDMPSGEVVQEQPRKGDQEYDPEVERGVRRAERSLSTQALWHQVDGGSKRIKLCDVGAPLTSLVA